MLSLTKKTDYAVIAMCHLALAPQRVASAREIARSFGMPLSLLMNILKRLCVAGLVRSVRGAQGGYALARPAGQITLADLVVALEGPVRLANCVNGSHHEQAPREKGAACCRLGGELPHSGHAPAGAGPPAGLPAEHHPGRDRRRHGWGSG